MDQKLPTAKFNYEKTILQLTILLLLAGVSACSKIDTADIKKADDPSVGTVVVNPPVVPKPAVVLTDMPFEQLVNVTSGLLDDFWRKSFQEMRWQKPYSTPKGLIPYYQPIQSGCGMLTMNNAFYCPADQKIYYDDNLMRGLYQEPGDYAAVTVLAHEWGHAVQKDLGILGGGKEYFTIQTELQADCFSGAFAKYILELRYLEEGDLEEGGEALLRFGDARNGKWFDPQAHGKPFQRGAYFNKGWESGLPACMG